MHGSTHKFGRGGGGQRGGNNKRNSFRPPQRPSSTNNKVPSISSSRNKPSLTTTSSTTTITPSSTTSPQSEESFSLISGDPPAFAAIIRLAPDLVDEIKRAESLSHPPQIKFHSNPSNTSGNVIDVGGKEFRFTWSHEMGGLCDIYEERKNGEDGNGLLVESGCSWRKLNVQRVLDESTKKHVKKRSEEYEQKHKSRKSIVLDQCNPSMKSQMQALAAAEASPWKFKPKTKRYFEPSQVGGHSKPVKSTTGLSSTSSAKGRCSTSPLPSPQNQSVSLTPASVRGNAAESQTIVENPKAIHARAKENVVSSANETLVQGSGQMLEASAHRESEGAGNFDLQNMLVTLLKENPKGMNIKMLEKAVGDVTSNPAGKIEPILKKIASCEPPGRYVLKSGVELESSKKLYTDNGSSPDDNNQKQFVPEDNRGEIPAIDLGIAGKIPAEDLEEPMQKFDEESNMAEKYDASQHFSDLFGDDEPPDHSEGQTAKPNATESGSDSDSGSSDSDSDSASRSRSRSPTGSGSASSSDSDGDDSSSNSKEASDVDVDIMSDDDKGPKKLQGSEHGPSTTPVSWSMPETMPPQDGTFGDQDGYVSEDVDIENDFLDDNEGQPATAPHNSDIITEKLRNVSSDHDQNQLCDRTDMVNKQDDVDEEYQHKQHKFVKSGGKSKRGSNVIQLEHDVDTKRLKPNTTQSSISRHTSSHTLEASPLKLSADLANVDNRESCTLPMSNELNRDDSANGHLGAQKRYNYEVSGKSAVDLLQSDGKPASRSYNIETADKAVKHPSNFGLLPKLGLDSKFQETNAYTQEGFSKYEDKGYQGTQDEEDSSIGKENGKFKESFFDQKRSLHAEPHSRKLGERGKKSHSLGTSKLQMGLNNGVKADFDRSPADRRKLHRESSDLELGELREPLAEEPEGTKRQYERGGSFKQLETKVGSLDSRKAELKGKPATKPVLDSGNYSSPNARGPPNNSDSLSKRTPEPYAEDSSVPHGILQSQPQQSRSGPAAVGSLSNKAVDHSKLARNEVVVNQGTAAEGYGETQKKRHIKSQREDSRKDNSLRKGRGNKSKKSNTLKDSSGDRRKDVSHSQGHYSKRKRGKSSSDENNSYSKYDKEEPELKGPIKSFSQYKEYVQEYREKYESYISLNKILENYRAEFQKLGMDLDSAKGRDTERYYGILAQLRDSYRRCGMRHKRLKKIFLVLHEELKQLKQMIKDFAIGYMKE